MSESSRWKKALIKIIEKLSIEQYQKMLLYLEDIPESKKDYTQRGLMAPIIIQHYGEKKSFAKIKKIMGEIPRKDYPIQKLLHLFVEKQGKKRKPGPESEEQQESPSELKKKKKTKSSDDDDVKTDDPGSLQSKKMSNISEDEWRDAMTKIFEKLDGNQYRKMKGLLNKSGYPSPTKMTGKFKKELPEKLIQKFGIEKSIRLVNKFMNKIPRKDPGVQNLLRPFMTKLKKQEGPEMSSQPKTGSAGAEEQNQGASSGSAPSPQKMLSPDVRITIRNLKASGELGQKILTVKIVQKSDLCPYKTKTNETKFYFYLGVADETDAIRVVVFGKERFPEIEEGHFYTIRDALMDRKENVLKVTERTKMSETGWFEVPRNVELEAEKLIFSPVYSIRNIQSFEDKKTVSVKGTVKEIEVIKSIQMKDKQDIELEDDTGSITITFWGEATKHLRGISNGDVVLVNNVKTNFFNGRVSLNSTNSTRITKVQSAPVQKVNIMIIGISKFDLITAELEVQINNQVKTMEIPCRLLAEGVGLRLEDDIKDIKAKLLKKVPFPAKAQIQGNQIIQLKAVA